MSDRIDLFIDRFRTKPCERMLHTEQCSYRDKCPFSHNFQWIRRPPDMYHPEICPMSKTTCTNRKCLYAHTPEEQFFHPLVYKTITCPYINKKDCIYHFCPYVHTGEQKNNIPSLKNNMSFTNPPSPYTSTCNDIEALRAYKKKKNITKTHAPSIIQHKHQKNAIQQQQQQQQTKKKKYNTPPQAVPRPLIEITAANAINTTSSSQIAPSILLSNHRALSLSNKSSTTSSSYTTQYSLKQLAAAAAGKFTTSALPQQPPSSLQRRHQDIYELIETLFPLKHKAENFPQFFSKTPSLSHLDTFKAITPMLYINTARVLAKLLPSQGGDTAFVATTMMMEQQQHQGGTTTTSAMEDAIIAAACNTRTFQGFALVSTKKKMKNILNTDQDALPPSMPRKVSCIVKEVPFAVSGAAPDAPAKGSAATGGGEPWCWEFTWIISHILQQLDAVWCHPRPPNNAQIFAFSLSRKPENMPPAAAVQERTGDFHSSTPIFGGPVLRSSAVSLWVGVEDCGVSLFDRSNWPESIKEAYSVFHYSQQMASSIPSLGSRNVMGFHVTNLEEALFADYCTNFIELGYPEAAPRCRNLSVFKTVDQSNDDDDNDNNNNDLPPGITVSAPKNKTKLPLVGGGGKTAGGSFEKLAPLAVTYLQDNYESFMKRNFPGEQDFSKLSPLTRHEDGSSSSTGRKKEDVSSSSSSGRVLSQSLIGRINKVNARHYYDGDLFARSRIDPKTARIHLFPSKPPLDRNHHTAETAKRNNILRVAYSLCKGLWALHARGISHRRIRPENIFFHETDNNKMGKLGDFIGKWKLDFCEFVIANEYAKDTVNISNAYKVFVHKYLKKKINNHNQACWNPPEIAILIKQLYKHSNAIYNKINQDTNTQQQQQPVSGGSNNSSSSAQCWPQASLLSGGLDGYSDFNETMSPPHPAFRSCIRRLALEAADVWSLGCCLYYFFTNGVHPFGDLNKAESVSQRITSLSSSTESSSSFFEVNFACFESKPVLRHFLEGCLASHPHDRWNAEQAMNHPLFWSKDQVMNFCRNALATQSSLCSYDEVYEKTASNWFDILVMQFAMASQPGPIAVLLNQALSNPNLTGRRKYLYGAIQLLNSVIHDLDVDNHRQPQEDTTFCNRVYECAKMTEIIDTNTLLSVLIKIEPALVLTPYETLCHKERNNIVKQTKKAKKLQKTHILIPNLPQEEYTTAQTATTTPLLMASALKTPPAPPKMPPSTTQQQYSPIHKKQQHLSPAGFLPTTKQQAKQHAKLLDEKQQKTTFQPQQQKTPDTTQPKQQKPLYTSPSPSFTTPTSSANSNIILRPNAEPFSSSLINYYQQQQQPPTTIMQQQFTQNAYYEQQQTSHHHQHRAQQAAAGYGASSSSYHHQEYYSTGRQMMPSMMMTGAGGSISAEPPPTYSSSSTQGGGPMGGMYGSGPGAMNPAAAAAAAANRHSYPMSAPIMMPSSTNYPQQPPPPPVPGGGTGAPPPAPGYYYHYSYENTSGGMMMGDDLLFYDDNQQQTDDLFKGIDELLLDTPPNQK